MGHVLEALMMSLAGMVGIFIVIGIIILCIYLLNKAGNRADEKKKAKEQASNTDANAKQ